MINNYKANELILKIKSEINYDNIIEDIDNKKIDKFVDVILSLFLKRLVNEGIIILND